MTAKNPQALRDTLDAAAEAIRKANYLTLPHEDAPGLQYPADVYSAAANLSLLAQRLPQLLAQIPAWLQHQYDAGNVAHGSAPDAGPYVTATADAFASAAAAAQELRRHLDTALNASSGLKAAE